MRHSIHLEVYVGTLHLLRAHVSYLRCALVSIDKVSATGPAQPGGENLTMTTSEGAMV